MTGLFGAAMVASAAANVQQSPYAGIAARNPFGLRPIPVAVEKAPEPPPAQPLPEVKITGITTLLGTAVVTLQYEDKQSKKVEFPPLLREGESYKDLVVERIDTENHTVVIRNGDARSTLDFVRNGVKPSAAPTMVAAATPPNGFGNVPTTGVPGSPNVYIGNALNSRPPLTPEQQRVQAEILRRKQMAEQQGQSGLPTPPLPPQGTGLNPNQPTTLR